MAILRSYSKAAERNKVPIGDVLERYLKGPKTVLEVASGTLQHAQYFTNRFPDINWTPSDIDEVVLTHFEQLEHDLKNINKPLILNALSDDWPALQIDLVLCINMIHISPWEVTLGLMRNAANCLKKEGLLITYGPYFSIDTKEASSNIAFDQSLRRQDPSWGIRDVNSVIAAAAHECLVHKATVPMPANNYVLVFSLSKTR